MIKRWKRRAKLLATSIVVVGYIILGVFNAAISGGDKPEEGESGEESATVKTIVGYSMEFRIREEMMSEDDACTTGGGAGETLPVDETSSWKRDENLRIFLFSAYYDTRLEPRNYVRTIGLLPRNSTLYCQIWYEGSEKQTFVVRKAVVHEIWSTNWGRSDNSCDEAYPSLVSCPAPVDEKSGHGFPTRVTFLDKWCNRSNLSVPVELPKTPQRSFVVCVKALNYTDHVNGASLAEWIELNAGLGAGKIIVYVTQLDEVDMAVLRHYQEKEIVEVRRFEPLSCPPRSYEDFLWQKRKMEVIAYNDCFYRNIDGTKFVIPLDIDEIIVPKIGNNWYDAFRSHFGGGEREWPRAVDEYSSFSVRNVYFFARYPGVPRLRDSTLPNGDGNVSEHRKLVNALKRQHGLGPRDSIFRRTVRSSEFSPESDSAKSFVHVPKTLSVFNHYAFHVLGDASRQYLFPETVFQLNHYRTFCDPLLIDGCHNFLSRLTVDDTLERFRNQISLVNK